MKRLVLSLCLAIPLVLAMSNAGVASPTPAPSPASSAVPQPAPPAGPPPWLKTFDPCAGPLELLNKIGAATPCVFVTGEGGITVQYGTANVPSNTQLNFMGHTLNTSGYSHAFGYPASILYVGVGPRSEIIITPPSFVQVNAAGQTLVAGASNMKFEYKQLVYVNLGKFPLVGLDLAYRPPTGSPGLQGAGPEYTINPILTQNLPHHFGLTLAVPIQNFTVPCATCSTTSRGWSVTPLLVPFWQSKGGTLLAVVVQHSFNPNVTPVAFTGSQLIGRHFSITVTEGGLTYTTSTSGPFLGLVNAQSTSYPSLFTIGVNVLIGHSDLPAALQH